MRIETAVKAIIVLLVILILSLGTALILMNRAENADDGSDTVTTDGVTTDAGTTDTVTVDGTEADGTTAEPPATDEPPATEPPATEPPATDPPITISPIPPEPLAPDSGKTVFTQTLKTDTGTVLNLRAELTGVRQADGKIRLTVSLYLDHYSISFGSRSGCTLSVGQTTKTFTVPSVMQDEEKASATLLQTLEVTVSDGETVTVGASYPARAVYAGVEIPVLSLSETVTVAAR